MKRVLALLLVLLLCVSFTACRFADKDDTTPTTKTTKEDKDDGIELRIGVISTGEEDDDYSEAAAFKEQIRTAATNLGVGKKYLSIHDDISTTNSALAEEAIDACIKDKCRIIFATSSAFEGSMKKKAAAHPDVIFVGLGDADSTLQNYFAFRIKTYEGAYLCGLIAGIQTESNKLGMIAPTDKTNAETCQIANAFLLGAQVEEPEATLTLMPVGATASESKKEAAVQTLKGFGCDMVLITTKDDTAVEAAIEEDMKVFTMYTMPDEENQAVLYSVMPRLTDVFIDTMQAVLSKQTPYFNDMYVGYMDGFLTCRAGSSTELIGDTYVLPSAAEQLMMVEEWDAFSGEALDWELGELTRKPAPIKAADGSEKIAASAGAPTAQTLNGMTWLMQGVTVIG